VSMQIENTFIEGCYIIHDDVINDDRGYFFESFNETEFLEKTGLSIRFVQDNQSISTSRGTLRGLHFQAGEFCQAKLVRVINGTVLNVAVDLRKESKTFGKHISVEFSENSNKQIFIPRGFAHGFLVLSDRANFFYKCDNFFDKKSGTGIVYNDPDLKIDWQISEKEIILSEKDKSLPFLRDSDLSF
jgi:dTDP-4-dehydrorhamnose 3,5-epimerase